MRYYKNVEDNNITAIGTGIGNIEVTKTEYDELMSIIKNKPEAPEGFEYRLLTNLTWELHEVPVDEVDPDDEISDEEALAIITGGVEG